MLLALIWGWSFLFIKVAVEGMTPPTVACLRVALGALVLHGWLRSRGLRLPRDAATWRAFVVVALFGSALPFTLLAWGEERITSALTAVVNGSTPLFSAIAAAALLGERLRRAQVVGLVLGFVGVAVAAGIGAADLTGSSAAGVAASTLAGACYGISVTWMSRHLTHLPPTVAATGQLTVATALLAPFALGTSLAGGLHLTPTRIAAILVLGSVGTGLAYLLFYRIVADLGSTKASLVTYVIPVVAVTVGVVVLDEAFHVRILLGGLLVVGGIALVNGALRVWRRVPSAAVVAVVVVALAGAAAGCAGGAGATGACEPARREALDPASGTHVLAGGPAPEYLTDPPTSGPHEPGVRLDGVRDEPLRPAAQVGQLEAGAVLIQHRDLDPAAVDQLAALAGDGVLVLPNPDLPAPVVATAWLFKQECEAVDPAALTRFVADHVDAVAADHG